jgi:3-mercaptopyruvate sulfurtransferase SseA
VPLGSLPESLKTLQTDPPVVVQCQGGARSAIAASLLLAHGFPHVFNLAGGVDEWQASGLPIDRDAPGATAARRSGDPPTADGDQPVTPSAAPQGSTRDTSRSPLA